MAFIKTFDLSINLFLDVVGTISRIVYWLFDFTYFLESVEDKIFQSGHTH